MSDEFRHAALTYLRSALGEAAPREVELAGCHDEQALEGEGPMAVFAFTADVGGAAEQRYWVIAGATEPNYYPDWGLSADEIYGVHLGTRFMLVMGVGRVEAGQVPGDAAERVTAFIADVAPGEPVEFLDADGAAAKRREPVVCFRCEDKLHGVFRVRIGQEDVYVLGLDCPPGVYRDVHLPPHVVYRRHLGALIRREVDRFE